MRRPARALAAVVGVVAVVVTVAAGGAARADTWSGRDRAHDVQAYRYSPDPPPCGTLTTLDGRHDRAHDLRRLTVQHGAHSVTLVAEYADLRPTADLTTEFHLRTPDHRYLVSVGHPLPGQSTPIVTFGKEPRPQPTGPCGTVTLVLSQGCAGITGSISPRHHTVTVTLPRRCLRSPAWVRAGVEDFGFAAGVGYSDRWNRGGRPSHGLVPPYGPRVHPDPA